MAGMGALSCTQTHPRRHLPIAGSSPQTQMSAEMHKYRQEPNPRTTKQQTSYPDFSQDCPSTASASLSRYKTHHKELIRSNLEIPFQIKRVAFQETLSRTQNNSNPRSQDLLQDAQKRSQRLKKPELQLIQEVTSRKIEG